MFTESVNFRFSNLDLQQLYTHESGSFHKKLSPVVVERFFDIMADIVAADDEHDLRTLKSRRLEKTPSECEGCYSMRLNLQFRLTLRFVEIEGKQGVDVIDVRDYH